MSETASPTFKDYCCLLCCPPWPSKIAAKLFFLPPEPTYAVMLDETGSKYKVILTEKAEWQYSSRELENIEVFMTSTSKRNKIACMYVKCPLPTGSTAPKFTILFSQGNAVDLGQMSSFYVGLAARLGVNIFAYDYSGYGASTGAPSETNVYSDIETAWECLRQRYGVSPERIILYGQIFGTAPTIDLAKKYKCAGVILQSPMLSGLRVPFPDTKRTWCCDPFPNIDKISQVMSPVLVIHGTEDTQVDFSHGLAIYERCKKPVEPLWIEGAGSNDIELYSQYIERLKQFVSNDLSPSTNET